MREHAKGTDSKQSLRGLLAGTQAEIDVRPQLEIYTDDVRCNHGATAGKLDDNMLFYLLSRGIEKDIAQQLLKWAFLEDVVSRIAVPELRKHIERSSGRTDERDRRVEGVAVHGCQRQHHALARRRSRTMSSASVATSRFFRAKCTAESSSTSIAQPPPSGLSRSSTPSTVTRSTRTPTSIAAFTR